MQVNIQENVIGQMSFICTAVVVKNYARFNLITGFSPSVTLISALFPIGWLVYVVHNTSHIVRWSFLTQSEFCPRVSLVARL